MWKRLTGRGHEGMTVNETTRVLSKIDNVFGTEDRSVDYGPDYIAPAGQSSYDPLQMGAVKQSEVDSHKRGIKEMSPFASYGPRPPQGVLRDDNEYMRNTGIIPIGGLNPRTVNVVMSGPQAGARGVVSTAEADIRDLHIKQSTSPSWG